MKRVYKRLISSLLLSTLVLIVAACGGNETSTTETKGNNGDETFETLKLRASSGFTSQHPWHSGFFDPWLERIENETDGTISFEVFTAGELVPLSTEYDALRQGTIDIALTFMAPYDPQRFPYTEVTMLPLLESDAHTATVAFQNMMKSDRVLKDGKTYYELEFADKGIVAFANPLTEPYAMATTRKKIEAVSDLNEGLRLRTPSRVHEILAKNLGITAISMPSTDAYDALSRNALDGIFHSIADWINFGFEELLKFGIEGVNFGHFPGHTIMTQETWDNLPSGVQEKIENAADEITLDGAKLLLDDYEEGKNTTIQNGGEFVHFNDLDPELRDTFNSAIVATWSDWIESLEAHGHAGKEVAMLWRDMLVEAGAVLPQEILDLQ